MGCLPPFWVATLRVVHKLSESRQRAGYEHMQPTTATQTAERSQELETGGCVRSAENGELDRSLETSALESPETEGSVRQFKTRLQQWWAPTISFAVATAIACYHNFFTLHTRATFYGDSRHYLETCGQLAAVMRSNLDGALTATGATTGTLASNLMLDGPILTLPPAIFFAIAGKIPTPLDWPWFTAAGCITHGINALLTCLLARTLTGSNKWALLAGLVWALYPAAIVSSERYLTEPSATSLLLVLVLIGSKLIAADNRIGSASECNKKEANGTIQIASNSSRPLLSLALVFGIVTGLLLLLKPALLPAAVAISGLLVFCLRTWNRRAATTGSLLAATMLVLLQWGLCTKAMTGVMHLTPQRVPSYNLAMGCNVKVDGWGAFPVPQSTEALSAKATVSLPGALIETTRNHPGEITNLFLRKLSRLWFYPWNDFRISVFGISAPLQEWWHSALVALSIAGLVAVASGTARRRGAVGTFVGFACVLAALGHLVYIPFETIARYGHSAIPYLVILAVYGLLNIRTASQRVALLAVAVIALTLAVTCKINLIAQVMNIAVDFREALAIMFACRLALIGLLLACACLFCVRVARDRRIKVLSITFNTLFAGVLAAMMFSFFIDAQAEREWSATLQPGQSVGRMIRWAATSYSDAPVAVLIDGNASMYQATIIVNGHIISDRPELLLRLRPGDMTALSNTRYIISRVGMSVDEVRNWWAVSFPSSWLRKDGPNEITIANNTGVPITIYGDYGDSWNRVRLLPAIGFFSPTEFLSMSDKTEGRLPNFVETKSSISESYKGFQHGMQDLSDEDGLQTGQYRICLMLGKQTAESTPANNCPATFTRKLTIKDFDPMLWSSIPGSQLRMNRYVLKYAMRMDTNVSVPPEIAQARFVRVRVSGMVRAVKNSGITSIILSRAPGKFSQYVLLTGSPPFIKVGEQWRAFEIRDLIAGAHVERGLESLNLRLFPGDWESVQEYGCDKSCSDALFKDLQVELTPIDSPGLDGPFEII